MLAVLASLALLAISERGALPVPRVAGLLEDAMAERLGPGALQVGSAAISLRDGPRVELRDVAFHDPDGQALIRAPRVQAAFSLRDGLAGHMRATRFAVDGAALTLTRQTGGRVAATPGFDIAPAAFMPADGPAVAGDLLDTLERLEEVRFTGLDLTYRDDRAGRAWRARDTEFLLRTEPTGSTARLSAVVENDRGGTLRLSLRAQRAASGGSQIFVSFDEADPADLASQLPMLDPLRRVASTVSGDLSIAVGADLQIGDIAGSLRLSEGHLILDAGVEMPFQGAEAYFRYDAAAGRFHYDEVRVATALGHLRASGTTQLAFGPDGGVTGLVSQLTVPELHVTAEPHLDRPLAFSDGAVTARVGFEPFSVELGEASFQKGAARFRARGEAGLGPEGWRVAGTAEAEAIDAAWAAALWPTALRPGVRDWFTEHIQRAEIDRFRADLRYGEHHGERHGAEGLQMALSLAFREATAEIFKTMPPVVRSAGTLTLDQTGFHLALAAGAVDQPGHAPLDVAGTGFSIVDLGTAVPTGVLDLTGRGRVPAAMALMGLPPFNLTAGIPDAPGLADGKAEARVSARFPMVGLRGPQDVETRVTAELRDVTSDRVVPGRRVAADALRLTADNDTLQIAGLAEVSGVPIRFDWAKPIAPSADGSSRLTGRFPLTEANLARHGILLPPGTIGPGAEAALTLDLPPAPAAPRYRVTADITPARAALPPIGWQKRPGAPGRVEVSGRLTASPTVERLAVEAAGLTAEGRMDIGPAGLQRIDLSRLRVGGWLDAPVIFEPGARPDTGQVTVAGGTVDLAQLTHGGGGGGDYTIQFRPDRLRVADGLALHGVNGRLTTGGALAGQFSGRINGGAELTGLLRDGDRVMLAARDGGRALRDAGIFGSASGGSLRVALAPAGRPGVYAGRFMLRDTRVRQAPVLMEILSMASIFGLVDLLAGPGVGFNTSDGSFVLTPDEVILQEARAMGPAFGVTLNGVYNLGADRLNMEGVVTPFYAINGALERIPLLGRLLGGQRGEGLLGMNYRVVGRTEDPLITVNPLSFLAPGAIREIFQRRPADDALSRALN